MNILVTGAKGQVGQELQELSNNYPNSKFYFTDRTHLDITSVDSINDFFAKNSIDYCINCAAYTAVDKAEEAIDICKKVNTDAVEYLAKACLKYDATLIKYSTDYVYHASTNQPYKENQVGNPQGVYAQTKLDGDLMALKYCQKSIVIRTSWVYSSFGNKHSLFLESLKSYKRKVNSMFEEFKNSNNGIEDIKTFFYNSVSICNENGNEKGCLITNTYNEFSESEDELINEQMNSFMNNLKELFMDKLKMDAII